MFYKTPLQRVRALLRNINSFRNLYYGKIYLNPITVRCGNITEYTQYIRNTVAAIAYDEPLQPYLIQTYDNIHTWLNGANPVTSIKLWLETIILLDECLDHMSEEKTIRHRILIELPPEYLSILSTLEQIETEVRKIK